MTRRLNQTACRIGVWLALLAVASVVADECEPTNAVASDDPAVRALTQVAAAWYASLDRGLVDRVSYCLGESEMYSWTNVPGRRSGGIEFNDMSREQQKLAWDLLREFMSEEGYMKARLIATEITQVARATPVGSHTVALFGTPEDDGVWGFQLDGHHLALNFLVNGSDIILAPAFLGTQPLSVNGQAPLRDEAKLGRQLIASFTPGEQTTAKVDGTISRDVIVGSGSGQQDRGRDYDLSQFVDVGMPLSEVSVATAAVVEELVVEYVHNLATPFANRVYDALELDRQDGFVVYDERGEDIYYRVFMPNRLLIEYNDINDTHVHTVVRLLGTNGLNDYGDYAQRDLAPRTIAEHFAVAAHHQFEHGASAIPHDSQLASVHENH